MSPDPPEVTDAQLLSVIACAEKLEKLGKRVTAHWCECQCCVAVHEANVAHVHEGYVVNRDGVAFYEATE